MTESTARQDDGIRELDESDLPEATRLYVRVFNAPPWNDQWTEVTAGTRLRQTFDTPGALGVAMWEAGRMTGIAIGYEEQWYSGVHYSLKELFVEPTLQGSGVGTRLMDRLMQVLRERDVERIYLLTAHDSPAATFYEKLGFQRSRYTTLMKRDLLIQRE